MVTFDSRDGANLIVFGRHPNTQYLAGELPPVKIGKGVLPVKLLGTTNADTSRQQFGIERVGNGPFLLTNYSNQALSVEDFSGDKRTLAPGMQTQISPDAQRMQRVKIGWKGGSEISVQSTHAGSNDEAWQVGFMWKKQPQTR
jgi:hypothetical protein